MTYNHRRILKELEALVSSTPGIQLSEISSRLGINRHTIENAMRSGKKISFREYRRAELIQKAQILLRDSGLPVKDIAAKLGYGSLSSFSRFVHRSTGKSPSQLRNDSDGFHIP